MTETTILDEGAVEEIKARANAATQGPWEPRDVSPFGNEILIDTVHDGLRGAIAKVINPARFMSSVKQQEEKDSQTRANALFIKHAREDIPALCATVKHLRAENERAHEEIDYASKLANTKADELKQEIQRSFRFKQERDSLQSQLEQLRAERERLSEQLAIEVAKRVNTNVERMEQSQKVSQSEIRRTFDDRLPDTQRGSYE